MTQFAKLAMSGITALSLAITPMSAQAGPDGEDVLKTIAGLAIIGALVNATRNNSSSSTNTSQTNTNTFRYDDRIEGRRIIDGTVQRRSRSEEWFWGQVRSVAVPARCERSLTTNRGTRSVYGARCLSRHYTHADRLPDRCRFQVRNNNNRLRQVYGARCLRREGWQLARN